MTTVINVILVALSLLAGWELFINATHWLNERIEGPDDDDETEWILYGKPFTSSN